MLAWADVNRDGYGVGSLGVRSPSGATGAAH
jgi:hypothetical protein